MKSDGLSTPAWKSPSYTAAAPASPICLVAGGDDAVAPADAVAEAAARAQEATSIRLPVGHFDLLRGRTRRTLLDHVVAFLDDRFDR